MQDKGQVKQDRAGGAQELAQDQAEPMHGQASGDQQREDAAQQANAQSPESLHAVA